MQIIHIALGSLSTSPRIYSSESFPLEKFGIYLKGERYAMAVDPSSSSTGIVIGNVETRKPAHIIAFKRDKDRAESHQDFIQKMYKLVDMWLTVNAGKIIAIKVEQPIKHPQQTPQSYATQKETFNVYVNLANRHQIDKYITAYKSWAAAFLKPYKEKLGLNLNAKNKRATHMVAQTDFREFTLVPDDCTDAYGLWWHYLHVDFRENGQLLRMNDNPREYNHKVFITIVKVQDVKAYLKSYVDGKKYLGKQTAKACEFIYNPKHSIEDNIRSFTSDTTAKRDNVYYTRIFPSVATMRYIIPYRDRIGEIGRNTPLYFIGYREN